MSKTLRKIIKSDNNKLSIVDDTQTKHQKRDDSFKGKKLKPYIKEDTPYKGKYKREEHTSKGQRMGNTKHESKLEMKNANRSLKKGVRQQSKMEIKKELDNLK